MKSLTLPNGKELYYLDKITALDIYQEIFEENDYFRHGLVLNDGDIIIDAGANIGLFTMFVCSQAKNLQIYCFEPLKPIYDVLQKNLENLEIQATQQIKAELMGLSDKIEVVEMQYYPKVSADSTAIPFDENRKIQQYVKSK